MLRLHTLEEIFPETGLPTRQDALLSRSTRLQEEEVLLSCRVFSLLSPGQETYEYPFGLLGNFLTGFFTLTIG